MTRSPRELATQKIQLRKQQEKLLSDLLPVVDALDRAADHWQQAQAQPAQPLSWWRRWWQTLAGTPTAETASTTAVVASAKEGIDMIRESMLSVLSQHQVVPLKAKGQPFDPEKMHALGQQTTDASTPPNTVVQEVIRGYQWKDRVLREAQVIVSGDASKQNSGKAAKEQN